MDEWKDTLKTALDDALEGMQEDPFLYQRVWTRAKQEEKPMKKWSISMVLALTLVLLTATALTAGLLWKDAGEKAAPMEKQHGYYDTWSVDAKTELVKILVDTGALRENAQIKKLLEHGGSLSETEKHALADDIMSAYVDGAPDTVTLLSLLEKLHGPMNTWPMEDLVWYNELLKKNDMLSQEDTHYILPKGQEMTSEQAVEYAKAFFGRWETGGFDDKRTEATFYQEEADAFYGKTQIEWKGRRVWSVILFAFSDKPYHADLSPQGEILSYSTPETRGLFITGRQPEENKKRQALSAARQAIAEQYAVKAESLKETAVYFGMIDLADEALAGGRLGDMVWHICFDGGYHVMLAEDGTVKTCEKQ